MNFFILPRNCVRLPPFYHCGPREEKVFPRERGNKGEIRERRLNAVVHILPFLGWSLCGEMIETSRWVQRRLRTLGLVLPPLGIHRGKVQEKRNSSSVVWPRSSDLNWQKAQFPMLCVCDWLKTCSAETYACPPPVPANVLRMGH